MSPHFRSFALSPYFTLSSFDCHGALPQLEYATLLVFSFMAWMVIRPAVSCGGAVNRWMSSGEKKCSGGAESAGQPAGARVCVHA